MSVLSVTKDFSWDMAHMLAEHTGLCKNVHGHTYKMQVTVAGKNAMIQHEENNPAGGMVVDFKELKEIVKDVIVDKVDHAFMTNKFTTCPVEKEIQTALWSAGLKTYDVDYRPTAENMAIHFARIIQTAFIARQVSYQLVSLTIWETPTSFATYNTGV